MKSKVNVSIPPGKHVAIIGPTGVGKTRRLLVPAILNAPPETIMIAVSTKEDLEQYTRGWRETVAQKRGGLVTKYDPTQASPTPSVAWDPIVGCQDWGTAIARAELIISAGAALSRALGQDSSANWRNIAQVALEVMLHAAALEGRPMSELIGWMLSWGQDKTVPRILASNPGAAGHARLAWDGLIEAQHQEGVSSIFTTLMMNLRSWLDPAVLGSTQGTPLDMRRLLTTPGSTHYVIADADKPELTAPVLSAHLDALLREVADAAKANGGRCATPVLFICDELPSVAPIPALGNRLRTIRDRGATIWMAAQDIAGVKSAYGPDESISILNNCSAKIAFGGLGDGPALSYFADLVGDAVIKRKSTGKEHTTESEQTEKLLAAHVLRQLKTGEIALIYSNLAPIKVSIKDFTAVPELKRRSELPISAAPPEPSADPPTPPTDPPVAPTGPVAPPPATVARPVPVLPVPADPAIYDAPLAYDAPPPTGPPHLVGLAITPVPAATAGASVALPTRAPLVPAAPRVPLAAAMAAAPVHRTPPAGPLPPSAPPVRAVAPPMRHRVARKPAAPALHTPMLPITPLLPVGRSGKG